MAAPGQGRGAGEVTVERLPVHANAGGRVGEALDSHALPGRRSTGEAPAVPVAFNTVAAPVTVPDRILG